MSASHAEPYIVVMPKLGLSMTEGTIVEWIKHDGDWVNKGEDLFTFESDKSAIVIEAPVSGSLHILVDIGQPVEVQTPIAVIGEDSAPTKHEQHPPQGEPGQQSGPARARESGQPPSGSLASPRARARAREMHLDLDGIRGTGIRGMIVVSDVERARQTVEIQATPVARRLAKEAGVGLAGIKGTGPSRRITRADVESMINRSDRQVGGLTGLRAIIADRLSAGWAERPQVTLHTQADAVNLVAIRERLGQEMSISVPFDALFVRIVSHALSEFAYMNTSLTASGVEELKEINIGVAADTDRGLLVPVLHQADRLSLAETCQMLERLLERAHRGTSLPDELGGGTFTITNLGMYGVDAFTPIINPPEAAILGIGSIVTRPTAWGGGVALREQVTLSLSFDHRLVDGAPAARFLARVRDLVEQPTELFGQE